MSHFTDWFRSWAVPKPKDEDERERFKTKFGALGELVNSTPTNCETVYLWQTQSDNIAKCKTSMLNAPKYVVAEYGVFSKYRRKETNV
jgi:hypothetical protein